MKRYILFVVLGVVALGAAADRFYIEDFTIQSGETRTVSILLDNETEYTAFQCDLQLPEGLTVDDESFALTDRKNSNHTLTVSEFPDNAYRLMSYSLKLKTYSGNSGALVTFDVTASGDFTGPVVMGLRNTIFTTEAGVEVSFDNEESNVYLRGDVNMDGKLSIVDVATLIDMLLNDNIIMPVADVNLDGKVSIVDVTTLINYLLSGEWPSVETDDHEWVDLGLPSSTLWATCNVGASAPEEFGDYFAWGETTPRDFYDWSAYNWSAGSSTTMTKYCTSSSYGYEGFTDNKTELDLEDDAAHVNWGNKWRMPTYEQYTELHTQCTWTWTTQNGVKGYLVTGPNGNTMFLPAAGYYSGTTLYSVDTEGRYWLSTLYSDRADHSYCLFFNSGSVSCDDSRRYRGFSIRAVRASQH